MSKIICFDVDGTLVENRSSWVLLNTGLGCPTDCLDEIYQKTESGQMSFADGVKILEDMYIDSGKATEMYIRGIFNQIPLKHDARETIAFARVKGYKSYLISGGIDIYVEEIAKKAGVDGYFAHAGFEFDDRGNFCRIKYNLSQTETKVLRIKQLSERYDVAANEIIYVGDGVNDVGAFKITGHGVAVYPYDRELENIAWKKIKELSELTKII